MFGTTPADLTRIRDSLATFDTLDLAARAAALQLVPENANRLARLFGVAGVVSSLPPSSGRPSMSATRWRKVLNEPPLSTSQFALAEDPFNNPWAETLTFHGGSHVVFPGVDDDATFVFRHLAKAIFRSPEPFSSPAFREEARERCSAALALSNEIARRANINPGSTPAAGPEDPVFAPSPEAVERFMEETGATPQEVLSQAHGQLHPLLMPPGMVVVPAAERFKTLRAAVSFTATELRCLLSRIGAPLDSLDPLVLKQGSVNLSTLDYNDNPLFVRPILHDGADHYIVAVPSSLVLALCNALVALALEHGVQEELADRYRWAVFFAVEQSLDFLGNDLVSMMKPELGEPSTFEAFFSLDSDKMIYVLLATDDLQNYDADKAESRYLNTDLTNRVQTRMKQVEGEVLDSFAPNEILHLVVLQGIAPSVVMTAGYLGGS